MTELNHEKADDGPPGGSKFRPVRISLPGYEWDGEWFVSRKDRVGIDRIRNTQPPRPYGVFDQLKTDLTSITSGPVYLVTAVSLAIAVYYEQWVYAFITLLLVPFFLRTFFGLVRMTRHGVVSTVRIRSADYAPNREINAHMLVGGQKTKVMFDAAALRTLLESRNSDVEMMILSPPPTRKPVAYAMAYRPVPKTE